MSQSLHNVSDLTPADRSVIEGILGHPLRNDEVLYIATLGVDTGPAAGQRESAWRELESIIGEMRQTAARSGLSSDAIDQLIDSEIAAVRYGRSE